MSNDARQVRDDYARAITDAWLRERRARAEKERLSHEARMLDVPWSTIGNAQGISKQAAQQRYTSR